MASEKSVRPLACWALEQSLEDTCGAFGPMTPRTRPSGHARAKEWQASADTAMLGEGAAEIASRALQLGPAHGHKYMEVAALPITRCDFTLSAWVLPYATGQAPARMFLLSDWTHYWSYYLALLPTPDPGYMSVSLHLRRNINSAGSDPAQGLVTVDSTNDDYIAAATAEYGPTSAGARLASGQPPFHATTGSLPAIWSQAPLGMVPCGAWAHVAATWSRERRTATVWVNGTPVAACPADVPEEDVQGNTHTVHHVGLKADGGDCHIHGCLLELTVHGEELTPGQLRSVMGRLPGQVAWRRRRDMLLLRGRLMRR